ncbi:hypothetical protein F5B18DRAFT_581334 [Nemania serpens]|nr:hypothetical protein F5B18DRAFT_581334 [Nemania serpens]
MSEKIWQSFASVIERNVWTQQLAGILPLSALIDFLEVPKILHTFELTGAIPLWCWPVTPAGSRFLLAERDAGESCCLDRYGSSMSLTCLDGRYGDVYPMTSPETIRLCLQTLKNTTIPNEHPNMSRDDVRLQTLEVIRVHRYPRRSWRRGRQYVVASTVGWIALLAFIALAALTRNWLAVTFLVAVPLTGTVINLLHGTGPRRLGAKANTGSRYNRLVVVAQHMNESRWQVYFGESTIVNSLLNLPLRPKSSDTRHGRPLMILALRGLLLAQWATAIGAAAIQDWNAYFITIWIVLCILCHTFVFSAERSAGSWLRHFAEIEMEKYTTQLSSRRALLNTVMALNPDTFALDAMEREKLDQLDPGSLLWIDPILKSGPDRSRWEEASRQAMIESKLGETAEQIADKQLEDGHRAHWMATYQDRYWCRYIPEGIAMAAKITQQARLTGRFVNETYDITSDNKSAHVSEYVKAVSG